jgi:hypothetical protein
MKKDTTSDIIKRLLTQHTLGGGETSDWKRLSKNKNEQGLIVREFGNIKTNVRLVVTEKAGGSFDVTAADPMPQAKTSASEFFPAMEQDQEKNKAADLYMEVYEGGRGNDNASEKRWQAELDNLRKKAGDKAIANRFCFACEGEASDGVVWFITPIKFWQDEGHCMDSSGGVEPFLPPRACEVMEAAWEFPGGLSPLEQAKNLMRHGFVWDKGFQNFIDGSQTALIKKIEA